MRSVSKKSLCDICQTVLSRATSSSDILEVDEQEQKESKLKCKTVPLMPGAEGCPILNAQLRVHFIRTRLFKLSEQEVIKLITPCMKSGSSSSYLSSKSILMCGRCESIVNEAVEIHLRVLELQRQIDKLGKELSEIKENADKPGKGENVGRKGRGRLQGGGVGHDGDSKGDKAAREMISLSLACLGKTPFPKREKKKPISPRKLRTRTLKTRPIEKEEPLNEFTAIGNNNSLWKLKVVPDDNGVDIKLEEEENPLHDSGDDFLFGVGDDGEDRKVLARTPQHQTLKNTNEVVGRDPLADICTDETDDGIIDDAPKNCANESDSDYQPDDDRSDFGDEDDTDDSDTEYNPRKSSTKKKLVETIAAKSGSESEGAEEDDENVEITDQDGKVFLRNEEEFSHDQLQSRQSAISNPALLEHQCKHCNKIYSSRGGLRVHCKKFHDYEINYSCPKCPDLEFQKWKELIQHRDEMHGHACEKCGKKLSRIDALFTHYQLVHKMKITYSCPLCQKVFKKRGDLRSHRARDHKVSAKVLSKLPPREPQTEEEKDWAQIPCWECGKRYLTGEQLDRHLALMHERPRIRKRSKKSKNASKPSKFLLALRVKCYFCFKNFRLEQRRLVHVRLAHSEKMKTLLEIKFPCEKCNGTAEFTSCQSLQQHFQDVHHESPALTCDKCEYPFLEEESLQNHLNAHKRINPELVELNKAVKETYKIKCYFCWEAFPDEAALQKHMQGSYRHRKLTIQFPCDAEYCEHQIRSPFASVTALNEHLSNSHGDLNIFSCEWCSWGFLSNEMLSLHKLNHIPRIKSKYQCPMCDHQSEMLQGLRSHYNSAHDLNLKIHSCPYCPKRFESANGRARHIQTLHKDNIKVDISSMIQCDKCTKTLPDLRALKIHEWNVHRDFVCRDCGQSCKSSFNLTQHRKTDHGIGKQYLCSICGKACLHKTTLRTHMLCHAEAKYKCPFCDYVSKGESFLKQHVSRMHTNPKKKKQKGPPPKFPCTECSKGYARKDSLDDHVRTEHTKESYRVWECETCGKRFKRQTYLRDHLKSNGKACENQLQAQRLRKKDPAEFKVLTPEECIL